MDVIEVIPPLLKLGAMHEICKGLAYLHEKKIVHGDLKSGNVLVSGSTSDEWMFKLTDFGQAHRDVTLSLNMSRSVAAHHLLSRGRGPYLTKHLRFFCQVSIHYINLILMIK